LQLNAATFYTHNFRPFAQCYQKSGKTTYDGQNQGNYGASLWFDQGRINARIPANGFVVLVKQ
jgi:hypothetical protein